MKKINPPIYFSHYATLDHSQPPTFTPSTLSRLACRPILAERKHSLPTACPSRPPLHSFRATKLLVTALSSVMGRRPASRKSGHRIMATKQHGLSNTAQNTRTKKTWHQKINTARSPSSDTRRPGLVLDVYPRLNQRACADYKLGVNVLESTGNAAFATF